MICYVFVAGSDSEHDAGRPWKLLIQIQAYALSLHGMTSAGSLSMRLMRPSNTPLDEGMSTDSCPRPYACVLHRWLRDWSVRMAHDQSFHPRSTEDICDRAAGL